MALQLGFGGSLQLRGNDRESLRQAITLSIDTYREYARAIAPRPDDSRAVFWRLAFSIMSVHSPIGATFEAYSAVRRFHAVFGRLPGRERLISLLRTPGNDGVVQYGPTKAGYLKELERTWKLDKAALLRGPDSDHEWRLRIQRQVKGLGMAKASFAVALCRPNRADVCCIDTHMHQLLTGSVPRKGNIGKRRYLELEGRIRELAQEHQVSTFAMQWLLWDAQRGIREPHKALRDRSV